jgi:hypothetical protein
MACDYPENYVGNRVKPSRARFWGRRILRNGLLLAEGGGPNQQPKVLISAFSTQAIKASAPTFWTISLCLSEYWQETNASGRPNARTVEALCWLKRVTLDIIGRKFSEAEMTAILCSLLSTYEFQRYELLFHTEVSKLWKTMLRPQGGKTLRAVSKSKQMNKGLTG